MTLKGLNTKLFDGNFQGICRKIKSDSHFPRGLKMTPKTPLYNISKLKCVTDDQ